MEEVADFEELAKKSWQSFSTMKRFVSEANRLENASWRLWFMERNRLGTEKRRRRRTPSSMEEGDEGDVEGEGKGNGNEHSKLDQQDNDAGMDMDEAEHEPQPRVLCVYCELHTASLSCHGCCHDAYCVSCFKLIHKKGHLATHTAVKIKTLTPRERERLAAVAHVHEEIENEFHSDHQQTAKCSRSSSQEGAEDTEADIETSPLSSPLAAGPHSPPSMSPDQSRHHPIAKDKSTRGGGGAAAVLATTTNKAKSWEIQMDMLLQRLMINSLHGDNDISVHNIDSRHSLGTGDESLASFLSDTTSEDQEHALESLLRQENGEDHASGSRDQHVPVEKQKSWSDKLSSNATAAAGSAGAHITSMDEAQERSVSSHGHHRKQLSVDVSSSPGDVAVMASSPTTTTTITPSSSASSPVVEPIATTTTPTLDYVEDPESIDAIPLSLFPATTLTKTKSRKKNSVCANCNGNHITIDCPLLENSIGGSHGSSAHVHHTSSSGGVDTVLRKCFTTIHNDNLSNSTHAFLGDEISVRGGGNFSKAAFQPSNSRTSSFGMVSISEDQASDVDMETAATAPVLRGLHDTSNSGEAERHWECTTWMVSSLATELPLDVYEMLRQGATSSTGSDQQQQQPSISGWIHLKQPGSKWCKRFVCLYRNNLWEYMDDSNTTRPTGYANLADGSVHAHQNTKLEFAFRYFRHSTADSPRDECWIQCDTEADATRWREALIVAAQLQIDDLFDMRPDTPTSSSSDESYELGKGRFASVRRARRRQPHTNNKIDSLTREGCCALKIIDKRVFWDLVAHETERDDTVIREILTQTMLTVRAGAASYCPVIRLLSLFETRSHLVMELELMREGDLHEEIVTKSAVSETRASFLVASLVQAIHFCQENRVAHRDVKLSNLALDTSTCPKGTTLSVIKLADFGMAAFVQADGMLKGRCGTPGFVAPEILTAGKGEAYPSGVDMFSVGVVTYTMLCGYEPFFGVNDDELIQMNKAVEYEFEEPEWASVSEEAKELISLMMEKDATRRITPLEALQHPFLVDASRTLDEAITCADSMRNHVLQSPLRLL